MKTVKVRPLIPYLGSKLTLMPRIFEYFPHSFDEWDFFDPHCGPANVLHAIPEPYKTETLFEFIKEITDLILELRDNVEALVREINSEPFSVQGVYEHDRQLFINREEWEKLPRLVRSARFFKLCWNRFQSGWWGKNRRNAGSFAGVWHVSRPTRRIVRARPIGEEDLRSFSRRLHDVKIFQGDSMPMIRDQLLVETAFLILDPPYWGEGVYLGQESPSEEYFRELIGALDGPEVAAWWIMVISMRSPEIRKLIPEHWHRLRLDGAFYKVGTWLPGPKKRESDEFLFSNCPLVRQTYRMQSKLF